jgi:4-hydroxybenzoate polyprenyltransferase
MTWRTALRLGRVSNLPTVWTNVLAAAVLAETSSAAGTAALGLACSLAYVGGMFLNDAFDAEFDARSRPERPIPSGAVPASQVFAVGFALLAVTLIVVTATARFVTGTATSALTSAFTLAALIVLYDGWHKDNPFAPVLMGLCRTFVYVTTAAALTGGLPWVVAGAAGVQLFYLVGLTYVARVERVGTVESCWPVACLAVPLVVWSPSVGQGPYGIALYVGTVGWLAWCLAHLGWRQPIDVPRAVVGLIAGIALVDALALLCFGAPLLALAAVVGFALTLALQRWVSGT